MREYPFALGVALSIFFAGCALDNTSVQSQAGAPANVPPSSPDTNPPAQVKPGESPSSSAPSVPGRELLQATVKYNESNNESVELALDEKLQLFQNQKPIVLPAILPNVLKVSFPSRSWKALRSNAYALFGTEVRELKTEPLARKEGAGGAENSSNEIQVEGLQNIFPSGAGQEGKLSIELSSEEGKKSISIVFRTPPKVPQFVETPYSVAASIPITLSSNITVIPLRRYELKNGTLSDWKVEMPYLPEGQVIHQIRRTSFNQGNCSVSQGSGFERSVFSNQLLVLPEGTPQSEMLRILSESSEKVSVQRVPSKANASYILYSVYSTGTTDPRSLGRNWTGSAKMLSPACGPTACSRKNAKLRRIHWANTSCLTQPPWNEIDEGYYCSTAYVADCDRQGNCDRKGKKDPWEVEFGACQSYFIDPISPSAYYDFTEVLGSALFSTDLIHQGRVYFDDLPIKYAEQASPLEKVQGQVTLWGSFDASK